MSFVPLTEYWVFGTISQVSQMILIDLVVCDQETQIEQAKQDAAFFF